MLVKKVLNDLLDPSSNIRNALSVCYFIFRDKDRNSEEFSKMIEIVTKLMKDSIDINIQRMATLTLGLLKVTESQNSLIECLKNTDQGLRDVAAWSLGEIGTIKSIDPLIKSLKDEIAGVRATAILSIGKLSIKYDLYSIVEIPLIKCLNDTDISVIIETIWSLGRLIAPTNVFDFNLLRLKERITRWRLETALILSTPGLWRDMLFPYIDIASKEMSKPLSPLKVALFSYRTLFVMKTLDLLIYFLKHPEEQIRISAAEAIINSWGSRSIDRLLEYLNDVELREIVIAILGRLGQNKAVKPLVKLLKDKNPKVRANILEALGNLGAIEVEKKIMECLKDENLNVQQTAARVLYKIRRT